MAAIRMGQPLRNSSSRLLVAVNGTAFICGMLLTPAMVRALHWFEGSEEIEWDGGDEAGFGHGAVSLVLAGAVRAIQKEKACVA
ncbi:hypothetical protein D3C75_1252780 [compost metagenome]